jgi:hypothetical protein
MSNKAPRLFNNLSVRYWYKYVLCLTSVLLVLGFVFETQAKSFQVALFSFWTILLMIILWVFDDALLFFAYDRNAKVWLRARLILHIDIFILWLLITAITFVSMQ